jgi:PAS domain S-box-containing protein
MATDSGVYCKRCRTPLVEEARYCHACGVGIVDAVTGEFELYDLDRFFTYAVDLCCIAGVDGRFKRINPAFERVLGWPSDQLLTQPFLDFVHPDDQSETVAEVSKLGSGQTTLSFTNRYRRKDGSYIKLHWTSYPEPGTGLLYAIARQVG